MLGKRFMSASVLISQVQVLLWLALQQDLVCGSLHLRQKWNHGLDHVCITCDHAEVVSLNG